VIVDHPLALADARRVQAFAALGRSRRLFRHAQARVNPEGEPWLVVEEGDVLLAVS